MTVEKPIDLASVWFGNGTEEPVDVYVNYSTQPALTDIKPLALGPEFQVKGKDDSPYGTYTFSARAASRPHSPVLAAVSLDLTEGRSFTVMFHQRPDRTHRFSAYENDFTASDAPRMTVRHTARPAVLTWRIEPKEFKIEIPRDEREGTLGNGQWQVATNVVQNDYRLEVLLNGELVAEHPDLELEHEKDRTVYIVGDPYPTSVTGTLRRFVLEQEFKLPRGAPPPAEVTPPQAPDAVADQNVPILFDCQDLELWETSTASTVVRAVDPDGVITDLFLESVEPAVGGIFIPDHGVTPAPAIGAAASATLLVLRDVPRGEYDVSIVANTRSYGERARCTLRVVVVAVTIEHLRDVAAQYEASGSMDASVQAALASLFQQAEQSLSEGAVADACGQLKDAAALVASEKNEGVAVAAAEDLERQLAAFRSGLGCG